MKGGQPSKYFNTCGYCDNYGSCREVCSCIYIKSYCKYVMCSHNKSQYSNSEHGINYPESPKWFQFCSIVIAPASTGRDKSSNTTVITTAHTNRGIRSSRSPLHRMLITVVMKLIAPKIEEAPAKWREKIARSTEGPACAKLLDRGG